jgi:membrane protease YdiL (CAAX protease family)
MRDLSHAWAESLARRAAARRRLALLSIFGYFLFPQLMLLMAAPVLVVAALGTFAAAGVANALALRIYERGQLSDVGLGWTAASRRNLSLGVLGGMLAAVLVVVLPVLLLGGRWQHEPGESMHWGSLVLLSIVLLFGAIGEELLFRGYGFQVLIRAIGPFATILPVSVLFAFAHAENLSFGALPFLNTMLWGVLLGYAFLRSGDLWLPIGIHFGWNWALPLLGVNLSGFTMNVTGYTMHWSFGVLWTGGNYGPEGGVFTTAVVGLLFYYLHRVPIQQQTAFLLQERPDDADAAGLA